MKRIVFALLACLISITSFAQVSISTDSPNVDVTVKRAFARGENVYLDLLITCHNRWEYVGVSGCTAYDDEGNYYDMWKPSRTPGQFRMDVLDENGERIPHTSGSSIIYVARDIPRKVRILIKEVDEYATSFTLAKIEWRGNNDRNLIFNSTIKNLPITRD